jgi:eukaryotic-like serine/threonine-protein kinase
LVALPESETAQVSVKLDVVAGPHAGKSFAFDKHDTFLVGRGRDAHFKLNADDPYFSRRHFLLEINPPRVRVLDLKSRNGVLVNGHRVEMAELHDGDELRAGHTVFKLTVVQPNFEPATVELAQDTPIEPGGLTTTDTHPLVPGYKLGAELGRGGMGVVYRAVRQADGVEVAIKLIHPGTNATRKQIERFLREADVLRQLRHPHVVGFEAAGETPTGMLFLAMELVAGPTAEGILSEKGPLGLAVAVRIMSQVLLGLAQAHALGYVHRDVKPGNILLGRAGSKRLAKLADFGLARAYDASRLSGLTLQGELGGTPAFMAPEQVSHYRSVMPAADQYSAAASLYRLLTNNFPHDLPKGAAKQVVHVLTETPVSIFRRRDDIPEELGLAIHKAMSREPEHRYADVAEFRRALLPFAAEAKTIV